MNFDNRLREWFALTKLGRLSGIELSPVTHVERFVSMIGGFLAIFLLILTERHLLGETGAAMLIGSMGATAVLLFAVPHGALSQPWAVVIGHVSSATVGVTCSRFIPDSVLAAACAVGVAIGVMHYLRAIHPPGGATALTAVIGGPQVQDLGYSFVCAPVLVNSAFMVIAAVALNATFVWRRYPAALSQKKLTRSMSSSEDELSHADFIASLKRIGTFVDISEEEFLTLRKLMREEEAARRRLSPEDVQVGSYYSNGSVGVSFGVRWVTGEKIQGDDTLLSWKVVAGHDRGASGISSRCDFVKWALWEVQPAESAWVRRST